MSARLDQHFLKDPAVRDRIVAAARLEPGDRVVEIGPGKGFLTRELAGRASLVAVEMDGRLAARLAGEFGAVPGFRLIAGDFLKIAPEALGEPPLKFVANLPYSVASPILRRILPWDTWSLAVLMFQKEVAERILAAPGCRDYGVLTLAAAAWSERELVCLAPPPAFYPRPKVDSAVVLLKRKAVPLIRPEEAGFFFTVARAAFRERRKTILNSLSNAFDLGKPAIAEALLASGISPASRAEEAPPEAFAALAGELALRGALRAGGSS